MLTFIPFLRYMKRVLSFFFLSLLALSCTTKGHYTSSPIANYRALWEVLDKGYCYFDEKLPQDSSWYDMYNKYLPLIANDMGQDSLFDVMGMLLSELKDGHVNIIAPFDVSRYSRWRSDYPPHLDASIRSRYLGDSYRIAGGLYYTPISYLDHAKDSIGYIVYTSFSNSLSESGISSAFARLARCKALIIDIRGNGGGYVSHSTLLASHFTDKRVLTGYMRHKTGPGHREFSAPVPVYLDTLKMGIKWLRPVVVLTNRGVYSAANDFTMNVKNLPLVTIMGDQTGGGGGLPRSSELPNGWAVRYSASMMTDADDRQVEHGILPHYKVALTPEDVADGKDTLIEEAIAYLNRTTKEYRLTGVYKK